ncbi:MAG: triose-phosphate isomerase [Pseudomonadales bacterium]
MRRGIAAGNWKMHGSRRFIADYVRALDGQVQGLGCLLVLFPPTGYLPVLADALRGSGLGQLVELGAQNLHAEAEGAFTGEMSGEMLADLGARWVLVGHSERREYAGETNELVARKTAAAVRAGLKPMVCVGEREAERDAGEAESVVVEQIESVLACNGADGLGAIAYEPVWAIGTGRTATPELAEQMHALIRSVLARHSARAAALPILYGGSVKGDNAQALFAERDIDGGLVGGASLKADEFLTIARALPGGDREPGGT